MNLEYYNVKKLIDLAFEKLVNTLGGHGFGSNFYGCQPSLEITMCRNGNFGLVFARGEILLTYMIFAYHWTS